MAEYFRDEKNQDVLLFIDNIFRFSQAGSEVSALLGRSPSAVGYQPTLANEMGVLQERITSTKKGSITSFQAVYVPADDLTDPAPAATFAHLDSTIVLDRAISELGIYPAVDPLASTPRRSPPRSSVRSTILSPASSSACCTRYKDLQDIHRDSRPPTSSRPRTSWRFIGPQDPAFSFPTVHGRRRCHRHEGKYVSGEGTIRGFKMILAGELDDVSEGDFYMKGGIDEVLAAAGKK